MPAGARQRAPRDQRLVAQQLAARVVARVAARRGAQALADDLEAAGPRRVDEVGELRAGALVDDGGAEALELVARQLVIARPGVEALRGQLRVEAGAGPGRRAAGRRSASCRAASRQARSAGCAAGERP